MRPFSSQCSIVVVMLQCDMVRLYHVMADSQGSVFVGKRKMPKDNSSLVDDAASHSPVGGLSDALYSELTATCQPEQWVRSPVGGLSLPEFLRILGQVE